MRLVGHLRAHVVSYLALVLALSGTAYALGRNSVGARQLAPDSVGASELAKSAVTSSTIKNGAVGAADLDDGYCGFTGQLLLVGFDFAPTGTMDADGSILPVPSNTALFSLFGNNFGGDVNANPPTFGLPKLDPPLPGTRYVVCVKGIYPPRN